MGKTKLDMKQILKLLEKRHASILEIANLTKELEDALGRDDRASSLLTLEMRAEAMAKSDGYMEEIWKMAEGDVEDSNRLRRLLNSDPFTSSGEGAEEEALYWIRRKIGRAVESLQEADKKISQRIAGLKSYYGTTIKG